MSMTATAPPIIETPAAHDDITTISPDEAREALQQFARANHFDDRILQLMLTLWRDVVEAGGQEKTIWTHFQNGAPRQAHDLFEAVAASSTRQELANVAVGADPNIKMVTRAWSDHCGASAHTRKLIAPPARPVGCRAIRPAPRRLH